MERHIIEISHLNKAFGSVRAVSDLSFHVRSGELFAFLGVNGAGKSTTISIMCANVKKNLDKSAKKLFVPWSGCEVPPL